MKVRIRPVSAVLSEDGRFEIVSVAPGEVVRLDTAVYHIG